MNTYVYKYMYTNDDIHINPHMNVKFIFENENGRTIKYAKCHDMYSTLYDTIEYLFDIPIILNTHGEDYSIKKIHELRDDDVIIVQELDYYLS